MNRFMGIAAAALICLPISAGAQSSIGARGSVEARVEGRQGSRSGESAGSAALAASAAAGLPDGYVRQTIREGEAKGSSPAAIDRAAMEAHGRLQIASEALADRSSSGRARSEGELTAAADAMLAGATRAEIRRVGEAAPPRRNLEASLRALAQLRASGVEGSEASDRIAARLKSGASDAEITGLVAGAAGLRRQMGSGGPAAGSLNAGAAVSGGLRGASGSVGAAAGVTGALGGGVF